jgi:ribosome biogenesis GTPase
VQCGKFEDTTMNTTTLEALGWRPFFAAQLDAGDSSLVPGRVTAVHRGRVELAGENVPDAAVVPPGVAAEGVAVGDWVLVDNAGRIARVLQRAGVFKRRSARTAHHDVAVDASIAGWRLADRHAGHA